MRFHADVSSVRSSANIDRVSLVTNADVWVDLLTFMKSYTIMVHVGFISAACVAALQGEGVV
jgi:hypothetical protein